LAVVVLTSLFNGCCVRRDIDLPFHMGRECCNFVSGQKRAETCSPLGLVDWHLVKKSCCGHSTLEFASHATCTAYAAYRICGEHSKPGNLGLPVVPGRVGHLGSACAYIFSLP